MIKTVKQACRFNPVIQDYRMSAGIENLADLINDAGDGREFFARNFVTHGMEQLFREGMLRLSGKSDQAVFELTQAMGGGKTHMMIALGLLARHPHLRREVLPAELNERVDFGNARIAAFNGRNNPDNYIWGEIASQLGEEEAIKPYWINGPKAVDLRMWKEIIGDQPTLILLDELPPYLQNASTQMFGNGTLADMAVYSLSALMSAALELPNCCIVIANLSGTYKAQTKALAEAVDNLQQEARRQAMTITPVQLAGNEIYAILKKRLIDELPDEGTIAEIAQEYAQQIKKAEDGGYIVAASIEQIAEQVRETYPFHPSFKHLVALFKENEGFRQTRGLMQFTARLLKSVAQRETDDVFLVGTQHLDLNDPQVKDEIERIAPNLVPAITHDIADDGDSIAEMIDNELGEDAARQVMTLLLASSLSRAVGGRIGLSESEVIEFLAAPNRKADTFLDALQRLREQAWYLHREEQRLFVKETENLSRQIERNAREIPQPKVDQALINRLSGILQPVRRNGYQEVQVLPRLDELKLSGPRVLIVVKPDGKVPPSELQNFFDYQQEKNNFLVLTGQDSHLTDAVEDRLRELYAIEQIHKRLKPADTLFEEARDRMEEAEERFNKALSAAYNRIYFPSVDGIDGHESLACVTIDNGLQLGKDEQSAEAQIEALLASPRANYKLAMDLADNFTAYFAMAEEYLWPAGRENRRIPWKDVVARAKSNPAWPWMPGAGGAQARPLAVGRGWLHRERPLPERENQRQCFPCGCPPRDGGVDPQPDATPRRRKPAGVLLHPARVFRKRAPGRGPGKLPHQRGHALLLGQGLHRKIRSWYSGALAGGSENSPSGFPRRRHACRHIAMHPQRRDPLQPRWLQSEGWQALRGALRNRPRGGATAGPRQSRRGDKNRRFPDPRQRRPAGPDRRHPPGTPCQWKTGNPGYDRPCFWGDQPLPGPGRYPVQGGADRDRGR
jgi:hypothetical protein